jgi:TonB-dependent receptor
MKSKQNLGLGLIAFSAISLFADEPISLSRMVVTEHRTEEGAPLLEQQYASNLINVVTAADIQTLPDVNAAEALRRVPGVSLWADTGEGRFVAIRGLDSDLNSTTFAGVRLLPTNPATIFGGGRAVALDVIPSGLIGSMTVTKTNNPDQDAEALGGTVDIAPKTIPLNREEFVDARIGSGYESLRSTWITDVSLSGGVRFGGKAAVPGQESAQPFSFIGTVSLYNDARGIDDVEPALNNATGSDRSLAGYDQRYYQYHRLRHAFGGELDYRPDATSRYFISFTDSGYKEKKLDNILTTNFDGNATSTDNRVFQDTISDGAYQKALVNHVERLTEQIAIAGGENEIGGALLDYRAAHVTGKYEVNKDVTTAFNSLGSGIVRYDNSGKYPTILQATGPDKTSPSAYTLGGYRSSIPLNQTKEDTGLLNLSIPTGWIPGATDHLKFGGSFRDKTYHADTTNLSGAANPSAVGSPSLAGYVEGGNITFYDGHYLNGPNLSPALTDVLVAQGGITQTAANQLRTLEAHAVDQEKISAGYFQYTADWEKFSVLAGLRAEGTKGTYSGNLVANRQYVGPISRSKTYTDYFPALALKYQWDSQWQMRLSRSSTIARPGFNQLNAAAQADSSANSVSTGNPALAPTKAASYDLVVQRYVGKGGLFSVGGFYKDLQDYIVSDVAFLGATDPRLAGFGFTGNRPVLYQSYANTSGASAEGLEFAFDQRFTELPGYLAGLGVNTNYTYVKSKFDIRPGETHSLPSTAKNTYNLGVSYELRPIAVHLSLSHVDKYLSGIGSDSTQDLYTDPVNWLDLGTQWSVSRSFEIYFNVKNLLDTPIRYTQGPNGRTIQREFYGLTYQMGVTSRF